MSASPDGARAPRVAAIVVSHDGERWIPHLVDSLQRSTRAPDRLIAVDTGSLDGSRAALAEAFGADAVVDADRRAGFGAAVGAGLSSLDAAADEPEWLWLLHDDCAPAPDALERLLAVTAADPEVAVVGCRVRAWPRARRLLEVGVTITGTGHRETGLELGEYDQGQHEGLRRVLAVSTAGMLVRRDVWDELGGLDPRLPLFRDDVDFGWRAAKAGRKVLISPDAIVFHAEAATRGVRPIDCAAASPHRADRAAALYTVLVNCSWWVFPWQYVRLLAGTVVRALGYLVGKLPGAAWDELRATPGVFLRPDRLLAARLARRRPRRARRSEVRALLPSWWTPYANGIDSVSGRVADTVRDTASSVATSARRMRNRGETLDTATVDDDAVNLPQGAGPVAWARSHPLLALTGILLVAAAVGTRGLWGGGLLQGGGLLPAPEGVGAWWDLYGQAWHPVALGSTEAASPYVVVLGTVGALVLGHAPTVVDIAMLLCVPLAGFGALVAARRFVGGLAVAAWAAITYAILPVVTGAMTSGRIGTVVATVLLPWLAVAAWPLLDRARPPTWRPAFATALVLAVMAAFAPLSLVMAAALAVLALVWLAFARDGGRLLRVAVAVVVPVVLLMPWSLRLLADPALLLTEAGVIDPATADVSGQAWQLPFGRLAASGQAPWWITAGVLVAAIAALLRSDRRAAVAASWLVIAVGLGTAALAAGEIVSVSGVEARVWIGLPVIVAQAGAIAAAAIAADGVTSFIQSGTFGWRQPVAAATSLVAIAAPVLGVAWWVAVAPRGDLVRATDDRLPAYIVDGLAGDEQYRVLVLTGTAEQVDYDLVMDDGVRLGDDSVDPVLGSAALDRLIADTLSEGQLDDTRRLAAFGIQYVMLPSPADADLVSALDGLPGMSRASTDPDQVVGWRVGEDTGLVRVVDPALPFGSSAEVVSSSGGVAAGSLDEGAESRLVTVAVPPDTGFDASVGGDPVEQVRSVGTTGFDAGTATGALEVAPPGQRRWWLVGEAVAFLVALVLATPAARRREGIAEVER